MQPVITDTTYERLSPNRKRVIRLLRAGCVITNPWINDIFNAVEDGFFEKASRILSEYHMYDASKKMLEG